jgi:hypothetical protein
MVIYNVTIKVDKSVEAAWVKWMKEVHMDELVATGLFSGHRLCKLLEQDEADGVTYSAQYFCNTIDEYRKYIDEYSQQMRDKGMQLFGGKFIAFRSVMQEV